MSSTIGLGRASLKTTHNTSGGITTEAKQLSTAYQGEYHTDNQLTVQHEWTYLALRTHGDMQQGCLTFKARVIPIAGISQLGKQYFYNEPTHALT